MALQICLRICIHVETRTGSDIRLNDIDWHHIYQKNDGANAKRERCSRFYDQRIMMGQGIFCGLPELDLTFFECQPAIQIVRHALFKRVFRVVSTIHCLCYLCVYHSVHALEVERKVFRCEYMPFKQDGKFGFWAILLSNVRQLSDALSVRE